MDNQEVSIVVDSTASIPPAILVEHRISVVPVTIQIGEETFEEDVSITKQRFYESLAHGEKPLTSQPAPGAFYRTYKKLLDAAPANPIISIHLTGKHSGTVQTAKLAAEMFPGADIAVVDSEYTSAAMGLLALAAARAARLGRTKQEILAAIEAARRRISVYVAVPTLEYLRRSGRVSFAQAALADLLAIKPILTMRNGWLEVAGKVRTYRRALERAISLVEEQAGRARVELAVVHANVPEAAEEFRRKIEARLNVVNTMIADIGSALAAHGGPGMLGLACLRLEAEPGPG